MPHGVCRHLLYVFSVIMNLCTYVQSGLCIHVCNVKMAWLQLCMLACYWLFTVCYLVGSLSMPVSCAYVINVYGYSFCMNVYVTIRDAYVDTGAVTCASEGTAPLEALLVIIYILVFIYMRPSCHKILKLPCKISCPNL